MIKKLFLCAALVGTVGLTGCVDDVESASINEIRNAKAEQLKAAADAEQARAQAKLIRANADKAAQEAAAAVDQANADYAKAQAAYYQALANQQNAATEEAQALAAVKLEEAQVALELQKVALQEAQARLQKTIAQYEADIADYVYKTQLAQQKLENLIKDKAKEDYIRISGLLTKYKEASSNLMTLQNSLSNAKFNLAKLQAGISGTNDWAQNEIKRLNKNIKGWQAEIDKLNAEIAVLKSADYEAAQAALPELKAKRVTLTTDQRNAMLALQPLAETLEAASDAVENSEYMTAIDGLNSASYPTGVQFGLVEYGQMGSISVPQAADGKYCAYYFEMDESGNNQVWTFIPVFTNGSENQTTADYQYNNNPVNFTYNDYSDPYYALVAGGADKLNALVADNVKALTDKATKAAKKLTDETKLQSDLIAAWKGYVAAAKANYGFETNDPAAADAAKKYQDAYKAFNAALKAVGTSYEIASLSVPPYGKNSNGTWWFDAEQYYDRALANIDGRVASATTAKNRADNNLANGKKNAEAIKGYLATLTAGAADFTAALKASNDAEAAFEEAKDKYDEIRNELGVVNSQINAYNLIVDANGDSASVGDINNQIESKENDIKNYQGYIDNALEQIADLEAAIETGKMADEVAIEKAKTQIATLEAEIEAQEAVVKAAKAALDAALAEDAPAEK